MGSDTRGVRWAKLAANYWEDPLVERLTPLSEILYVRTLAACADRLTDGHVGKALLASVAHDLGKRSESVARLVSTGLWIPDDDGRGWTVRNYLKWNRSAEDVAAAYERDRQRKRSKSVRAVRPESERKDERDSERNPNGFQCTETETEELPPTPAGSVGGSSADAAAAGAVAPTSSAPSVRLVASAPPDLTDLRQKLATAASERRARDRPRSTWVDAREAAAADDGR